MLGCMHINSMIIQSTELHETTQQSTAYKKNHNINLTMVSSTGNKIVAHARLLVNSVNSALTTITTKMIVISGAPIIK